MPLKKLIKIDKIMANKTQIQSTKPSVSLNPESITAYNNSNSKQGAQEFNAGGVFMTHSFVSSVDTTIETGDRVDDITVTSDTRCCEGTDLVEGVTFTEASTVTGIEVVDNKEEIYLPIVMTDDFDKVYPVTRNTNRFDSYKGNTSKFDGNSNPINQP
tara:strand:+ start:313 stop:786 length:474 start_codon:yes stop_codon:yes gene_type:complete